MRSSSSLSGLLAIALLASAFVILRPSRPEPLSLPLSLKEARELAREADNRSAIPLAMNDLVFPEFRRLLSNPDPDGWCSIESRARGYRKAIASELKRRGLPDELRAIPAIETGYRNTRARDNAGIWHFSTFTAQLYGLIIDGSTDERLDPESETRAVLHYFEVLHDLFGDWRLAIQAYYRGEGFVFEKTAALRTSDPWALERDASPRDRYLSRATAAIIAMKAEESTADIPGKLCGDLQVLRAIRSL